MGLFGGTKRPTGKTGGKAAPEAEGCIQCPPQAVLWTSSYLRFPGEEGLAFSGSHAPGFSSAQCTLCLPGSFQAHFNATACAIPAPGTGASMLPLRGARTSRCEERPLAGNTHGHAVLVA